MPTAKSTLVSFAIWFMDRALCWSGADFCKFKHRQILSMSIPAEIERVLHLQSSRRFEYLPARHVLRREPCPAI